MSEFCARIRAAAGQAKARRAWAGYLNNLRAFTVAHWERVLALAAAGECPAGPTRPDLSRFREVCAECNAKIPPGRPGRKCEACRAKE